MVPNMLWTDRTTALMAVGKEDNKEIKSRLFSDRMLIIFIL